jgi:3',5'-cyclic AMP phosphodiesterase CpdA
MMGNSRGIWRSLSSLAIVFVFALTSLFLLVGPGAGTANAYIGSALGIQDTPKITKLIYPTFGNPVIAKKGENFTIEYDPRAGNSSLPVPAVTGFKALLTSTNEPYPVTKELPVISSQQAFSREWPNLSNYTVYRVTVNAPLSLPDHLFDLTVQARTGGAWVTDMQPHAVQTVNQYKDHFSFCQLTDIHMFGPELARPYVVQKERGARQPNGPGAVYYQKAIAQVNRMKPDFCVFTGDFDYCQSYYTQDEGAPWGICTEYEFEASWFYEETLKLDVPVYMVPGNHDGYNEGQNAAHEDGQENWKKLFGPLYHSFDYGNYHFLALNSMDWPPSLRETFNWFWFILQPYKYKGQLRGGGDPYADGLHFELVPPEETFTDQLAWMRDDLKAHQGAKMRIVAMHHDPMKASGHQWKDDPIIGMGNGEGRLASVDLMRKYNVALEISGHDHWDGFSTIDWTSGGGQVKFVNTTSVEFQADGDSPYYPGYRRIWINDGQVESYNYLDPMYSYPVYDGTNVGGTTNLHNLSTPAVESTFSAGPPWNAQDVSCTIADHLIKPLPAAYMEFPMPYLSGHYYYVVENGGVGEAYDDRDFNPDHRTYEVTSDVNPGELKTVRVHRSGAPDLIPPSGSVKINGGAVSTKSRNVTLTLEAADAQSGIKDMMISNDRSFRGASWEDFQPSKSWSLEAGPGGRRTVYVRLRDLAMPGNTITVSATIMYKPASQVLPPVPVDLKPPTTWFGLAPLVYALTPAKTEVVWVV